LGAIFAHTFREFAQIFREFVKVFRDFSRILKDFARILKDFAGIFTNSKSLGVCFHPLHPLFLHQWLRLQWRCEGSMDKINTSLTFCSKPPTSERLLPCDGKISEVTEIVSHNGRLAATCANLKMV